MELANQVLNTRNFWVLDWRKIGIEDGWCQWRGQVVWVDVTWTINPSHWAHRKTTNVRVLNKSMEEKEVLLTVGAGPGAAEAVCTDLSHATQSHYQSAPLAASFTQASDSLFGHWTVFKTTKGFANHEHCRIPPFRRKTIDNFLPPIITKFANANTTKHQPQILPGGVGGSCRWLLVLVI